MPNAFASHRTRTAAEDHRSRADHRKQCDYETSRNIGKSHRLHDLWKPQNDAVETSLEHKIRDTERNYAQVEQDRPQVVAAERVFSGETRGNDLLLLAGEP
jgi:hypothetical protein